MRRKTFFTVLLAPFLVLFVKPVKASYQKLTDLVLGDADLVRKHSTERALQGYMLQKKKDRIEICNAFKEGKVKKASFSEFAHQKKYGMWVSDFYYEEEILGLPGNNADQLSVWERK